MKTVDLDLYNWFAVYTASTAFEPGPFSRFSGHLYERLLKIMMLSTIRHTNAPVKFWILKHYLSPSLRDFLPAFAKEYGFQYEYVQYKWPRWLNQQKEKQRIIWGYKVRNHLLPGPLPFELSFESYA